MPNWCSNELTIHGADVPKIIDIMQKSDNVFESLIGNDPSVSKPIVDWYNHNVNWFGTKWDVSHDQVCWVDTNDTTWLTVSFETAWAPPIQFFETLCNKYNISSASLKYDECGMNFSGVVNFDGYNIGTIEYDSYLEGLYQHTPYRFWGEVNEYRLQSCAEEGEDIDVVLKEFDYVGEDDRKFIVNKYKSIQDELTNNE